MRTPSPAAGRDLPPGLLSNRPRRKPRYLPPGGGAGRIAHAARLLARDRDKHAIIAAFARPNPVRRRGLHSGQ